MELSFRVVKKAEDKSEAGHSSLLATIVAGDDASEEEQGDGEDAEVRQVGDEDDNSEAASDCGEDKERNKLASSVDAIAISKI